MAIKKDGSGKPFNDGEPTKYEAKGDFGQYNEPSWVPEDKCKCCAMVTDEVSKQPRRRTSDELRDIHVIAYTANKELPVIACHACDKV